MNATPYDTNRIIGNKVYAIRHSLNMTQQELAERCDLSVTFISEIENGHKSMSIDTLIKLARGLHVSLDTIVFEKGECSEMQSDVVSMMSTLPLEYNESILLIAREFTRLNLNRKKDTDENSSSNQK